MERDVLCKNCRGPKEDGCCEFFQDPHIFELARKSEQFDWDKCVLRKELDDSVWLADDAEFEFE